MVGEQRDRLLVLQRKVDEFGRLVNIPAKAEEIAKLEARMSEADFWNDQGRAKGMVATLKSLKSVSDPHTDLSRSVRDAIELLEMAEAENDQRTVADVEREMARIEAVYGKLELSLALSGRYDKSNVFMTIHPGAGGTESCDWAEILYRMYSSYCARVGWTCDVMDMLPGEEAGMKSCTLAISGENVYGYLKSEMGTHRLVRISPFDSNARRHTSFTAVEVTPEVDEVGDVTLDEKDLRIDTYRASGAGGQHVNKTDSAVRITHVPTGMFVACQTERSQVQNKARAMKALTAKLQQLRESERLEELADLKGARGTIGWGHQIRSYVMMPYQMVKDLRTRHETSQIQGVLDGDLQPFIDAYLRWRLGGSKDMRGQDDDE
ncbi:MAG: peptide chain release factor 2 [Planctomycetes bacterium]|nr:peptide chain release factor 2 [Planctomycetota bacterium]